MSQQGWISIHRKIKDCWLYNDKPFDRTHAWLDLLLSANHQDKKISLGNELILVKRGTFITSELKLMDRWGWGKEKTRHFLKLLEQDGMIKKQSDRKKTLIEIINYDMYQNQTTTNQDTPKDSEEYQTTDRPQTDHEQTTDRPRADTNNNDNNSNNDNKNKYSQTAKAIWTFYLENFNQVIKGNWSLTKERQSKITARLNDGYSEEQLKQAILNFRKSTWHIENNYFDIIHCFKNQTACEKWVNGPADNKKDDWRF